LKAVEASKASAKHPIAVFSGRRGRPTQSSGVNVYSNQPDLGRWWKARSTSSEFQGGGGESSITDRNSIIGLICWGFRGPTFMYSHVSYSVKELLNDLHVGGVWYPEPHLEHVSMWITLALDFQVSCARCALQSP
jgi:hypothetical protein